MNRVLLICYYFPPLGGAGINRPLALYKHLKEYDIDCDILTVKPVSYRNYEPEILKSLNTDNIYRSGSNDPQRLLYLMGMRTIKDKTINKGKNISDKFFPDSKIGWVKKAVKLGRVLIENKKHDAIISTSPPISTHLIAKKLSSDFKIPWLADFRDYWTSYKPEDWFEDDRSVKKANDLLAGIKNKASVVTCASRGISDYLETGEVIYNSFDLSLNSLWRKPENTKQLNIGILGTIDKITPIKPILNFLNEFIKIYPELNDKILINHVGDIKEDLDISISDYKFTEKIKFHGLKTRTETINILNQSTVFLFSLDKKFGQGIITSRLFDLIASGRPIIGIMNEDLEASDIIENLKNSFVVNDLDLHSGCQKLFDTFTKISSGEIIIEPDNSENNNFSANKMVEKFVNCLDRINKKEIDE